MHLYVLPDHYLIFFIEWRFISVTADQDVGHPGGGAAHDGADAFHRGILVAFYDEFVMDMPELGTYGSVGDIPSNRCFYPTI